MQGWVMTGATWPGSLTSFMRGRPDNSWRNIKVASYSPPAHLSIAHSMQGPLFT